MSINGSNTISGPMQSAMLRSEQRRIIALLAFLALLLVYAYVRLVAPGEVNPAVANRALAVLMGMIVYEAIVLCLVRWAIKRGRTLPLIAWVSNVIVENTSPTLMLLVIATNPNEDPFQALGSPTVLVYALFIALSVLRLRPWLCVLAGAVSALGHAIVLRVEMIEHPNAHPNDTFFEMPVLATYQMFLVLLGIAGAFIAAEMRRQVTGALREADTRRELDRVEKELDIARSIQSGLLPSSEPDVPGYEIAGWNRPADQTGGDYFDWHTTPDGCTLVTIADVSGHGVGPALVSVACRAYARASAERRPLERFVEHINALLLDDLSSGRFVTMAGVLIDPGSSELRLVSAGHGPVLVCRASGEIESIMPGAMPVGISDAFSAPDPDLVTLSPGDSLVLVTDGFFEWPAPSGERFGLERLNESLREHRAQAPSDLIQTLHAIVNGFALGSPQQDDLTAVIIRRSSEIRRSSG